MLRRLLSRLRHLVGAGRFRRELDEEMAFHVEALKEDLIREGLDSKEARRQARIRFGSTEHIQLRSREERGLAVLDEIGRNLRVAVRRMGRTPLFASTFVITLSLCIGFGTSVFSVADALLMRPLPYPAPHQLARAVQYNPGRGKNPQNTSVDGRAWERIRDEGAPLDRAVYRTTARGVSLSTDQTAAFVQEQRVGAGYFRTLGIPPAIGREFTTSEDIPDGPAVAILSHDLWSQTFLGDPDILGATIRLKGEPHTVVGIMPDFQSDAGADVWTPLRPSSTGEGAGANYAVLVRIPEGMSFEEADARLGRIDAPSGGGGGPERRFGLVPLDDALSAGTRIPMVILVLASGLMVLVGCANLAGLQIARYLAREAETATRQALGGGTAALVREALTENVVLGLLGALGGLAVASLGIWGLDGVIHSQLGIWQEVHLDTRAVFAALGLTGLATLGFCVTPAFQVASPRLYRIITSGSRVVGGGSHGVRKLLLIGQVAMVTTLLLVAGLLVRSYRYLDGLDPGFDPSGVLTVQFSLDHAGYADARNVESLFGESLDAIRRIRGVSAAAVTLTLPYERALNVPFQLASEDDYRLTNLVYVTPGFFSTLEIPLLQGRVLQGSDRAGEPSIAMANQAFVEAYFRDTEVLGSSANVVCCGVDRLTIVGVVGNVQQSAGWGGTLQPVWETPTLYVPAAQLSSDFFRLAHVPFSPSWLVRGSAELAPQVTQVFRQVAPDLALARVAPLEEVMDLAFSWQRLEAAFLITVAAFALLLAAVGLYGIVAHEVQERRGEIGLRLALGASPRRAVLATAAKGLTLTLYGVALGSVLGLGLARVLMGRLIFGLRAHDPTTLGTVLLIMTIICSVASLLPAARVARIDPADVLKAA